MVNKIASSVNTLCTYIFPLCFIYFLESKGYLDVFKYPSFWLLFVTLIVWIISWACDSDDYGATNENQNADAEGEQAEEERKSAKKRPKTLLAPPNRANRFLFFKHHKFDEYWRHCNYVQEGLKVSFRCYNDSLLKDINRFQFKLVSKEQPNSNTNQQQQQQSKESNDSKEFTQSKSNPEIKSEQQSDPETTTTMSEDSKQSATSEEESKQSAQSKKSSEPFKQCFVIDETWIDGLHNATATIKKLDRLKTLISFIVKVGDPKTDCVVLSIDCPGGVVSMCGEFYSHILRLRNKGFYVTACINRVAASGGYLIASACNHISAAPMAVVGSIGVRTSTMFNVSKVIDKTGVQAIEMHSGQYKIGISPFVPVDDAVKTKEQQSMDDILEVFKEAIYKHTDPEKAEMVRKNIQQIATGETWLATKAVQLGLVHSLETLEEHLDQLCEQRTQVILLGVGVSKYYSSSTKLNVNDSKRKSSLYRWLSWLWKLLTKSWGDGDDDDDDGDNRDDDDSIAAANANVAEASASVSDCANSFLKSQMLRLVDVFSNVFAFQSNNNTTAVATSDKFKLQ